MWDNLLFAAAAVAVILAMLMAWSAVGAGQRNGARVNPDRNPDTVPTRGRGAGFLSWYSRRTILDWLAVSFLSLVSAVIVVGWFAVALGQLGAFSLPLLSLLLLGVALAVFLVGWRSIASRAGQARTHRGDPDPGSASDRVAGLRSWRPRLTELAWQEYALLLLLAVAGVVYARPHEYLLGGTDAGSYMNMAAHLARTGSFVETSDWLTMLGEYGDTALRQQPPPLRTDRIQFVGWYIDDADPSRMLFQFYPLHAALLAVGVGLAGLGGGLLVTPLWGVLAIAAVYLLARQLFGRTVALLAALLLAVTPTHIYFARYPTAEPLTLLLLFASLYAYQMLWDRERVSLAWGLYGGAAFGAAMLARIDLPLVLMLLLAAFLWQLWTRQWHRGWSAFAALLVLSSLHQALFIQQMSWPYVLNTYGALVRYMDWEPLLLGGSLFAALVVVLLWVQRRSLAGRDLPAMLVAWLESGLVRTVLIVLIIGLSLFAYFLYPVVKPAGYAVAWPGGETYPVINGENWVRIGWYLTPLGLAVATGGLALIVRREPLGRLALFLLVGVLTTIQYVYNLFNTPYHIYAMRRYVPIVIPMLMIYAAYGICAIDALQPRRVMRAASALLAISLIVGMLYQGRIILVQRDFAGLTEQLVALQAQLRDDAVLIIAEPPSGQFGDALGVPLHFAFGHEVVTIRNEAGAVDSLLERVLEMAAAEKRPVQLLAVDAIFPAVRASVALQPAATVALSSNMLMNTFTEFPSTIQPVNYGVEIYDVSPRPMGAGAALDGHTVIDVGTLDAAYIDQGFHAKEVLPNAPTMRWTDAEASIQFPVANETPLSVAITAMIYRPQAVPPTPVTVWLDGAQIGSFTPEQSWQTHVVTGTSAPVQGISTLTFLAEPFSPAQLGISADERSLGFLLDAIVIEPRSQ